MSLGHPDKIADYISQYLLDRYIEHDPETRYAVEVQIKDSSVADCGTTGRKLAVDFYGGNCRIGGGSPWTKDASKADLTLNLVARRLAKEYARQSDCDTFVRLACCIGKQEVEMCVQTAQGDIIDEGTISLSPAQLRSEYKLDTPIYASMCRWGLFGEYQQDKVWEQ